MLITLTGAAYINNALGYYSTCFKAQVGVIIILTYAGS